jgi:hypothetical protein
MKEVKNMSQLELGAYVQTYLFKNGARVVLSGGAAVTYYTEAKYISKDLDMINVGGVKRTTLRSLMKEIGFKEEGRYFYHPENRFIVEFPEGPLSVGDEPIVKINSVKFETGSLNIISVTDCLKDRLAAFFHWGDRQCLSQAVMIVQSNKIEMDEIKRWSKAEGMLEKFQIFEKELILTKKE